MYTTVRDYEIFHNFIDQLIEWKVSSRSLSSKQYLKEAIYALSPFVFGPIRSRVIYAHI